jgi:hypothetical protein
MYPFPAEFDVGQFRFAELEMICFAANAMYLHFGRKLMLTVECEFEYCEEATGIRSNFPLRSSNLIQLIGSRVTEASVSEKRRSCCDLITAGFCEFTLTQPMSHTGSSKTIESSSFRPT